ncbi:MAG TPA: hypothetical protein VM510_00270, partial [Caulifigura sp.]|nr:hypothetical protein [Caulifigura sp.]
RLAQRWSKSERGPRDGARLFAGARSLLDRVLARAWSMPVRQAAPVPCNPRFDTTPHINVPEGLGIVEELNRRPAAIRDEVVEHARENLSRRRRLGDVDSACPLVLNSGFCACSSARPLTCRGRCCVGLEAPPGGEAWARKLGEAIDSGIEEELREQHLDADRYDMNEVVLTLLEHPGSGERWSRGEQVIDNSHAGVRR